MKIRIQLAVQPHEHIAIERRRHSSRVVICRFQHGLIFHQVDSQQQAIARIERRRVTRSSSSSDSPGSKLPMLDPI